MTLRAKTLLIVGTTLLGLLLVLYAASSRILSDGFTRAEEQSTRHVVQGVLSVISQTVDQVDQQWLQWSAWDDTYAFVENRNRAYIESNLINEGLATTQTNFVAFVHSSGRLVFGTAFDPTSKQKLPIPVELKQHLVPGDPLLRHDNVNSSLAGLIMLPKGAMVIASRPIVTSENKGPIRGTLIAGRYLDDAKVERLSQFVPLSVDLLPINGESLPDDFKAARASLLRQPTPYVLPLSADRIAGYTVLKDIYGKPILLLRVTTGRNLYKQGLHMLRYFMLSLAVLGIVFLFVALIPLEKLVLSRLTGLSADVSRVSKSDDLSARVEMKGNDELSHLAGTINGMLEALQKAQRTQMESEELNRGLAQIVLSSSDALYIAYPDSDHLEWHGHIDDLLGYAPGEFPRTKAAWQQSIHPDDRAGVLEAYKRSCKKGETFNVDYRVRRKDGTILHWMNIGKPIQNADEKFIRFIGACTDITERKTLEERLAHQAFHDPLTNLPNRALFLSRLKDALIRSGRTKTQVAVMFVDLDNFKIINDSLGHSLGDQLLVAIAGRLQKCLRAGDTAARFGGDEFALIIDSIESPNHLIHVAERIIDSLRASIELEGHEIHSTPSIGIALSRSSKDNVDELLRNADAAMYEAKRKGKARYQVFETSMSESALERLQLENDLRHAVERDELVLHYQPKIRLKEGTLNGFEALVRWQHPDRGLVPPLDFIPVAEETGLIIPVGQWVLREACRQAQVWQNEYPGETLMMSVNLSAKQFQDPNIVQDVSGILQETGLNSNRLILEITESAVMEDAEANIEVLRALKNLGVCLSVDDFGTGYSSLAYLRSFPLDFLKIDRKFVADLRQESRDAAIVSSMISLGHALNLTIVAEGTETPLEVDHLRRLNCDLAQGYCFARPMHGETLQNYLASQLPAGSDADQIEANMDDVAASPAS
jgi:diguanylate cyclase (GGDEF)-like protein/PAS domain S-box-containing protein